VYYHKEQDVMGDRGHYFCFGYSASKWQKSRDRLCLRLFLVLYLLASIQVVVTSFTLLFHDEQ